MSGPASVSLPGTDHTHDPDLRSWENSANGHDDFPIQNLPLGVFSPDGGLKRIGIAIGGKILDVAAAGESLGLDRQVLEACRQSTLNRFMALGGTARLMLRHAASALLAKGGDERYDLLHDAATCTLHLPAQVGDYTDFYAGIHHARNVGTLFRPDNPLLPNYKFVPIGYHGRASSVQPSGAFVHRPRGQIKRVDSETPEFAPSARLDYELELGIWVGPGNETGQSIPIGRAAAHIAGYCLLNDWSARDIQAWEYQPLGPFLAKSFATTISPWLVTPEALAPFRVPQPTRPEGDPKPLAYLSDDRDQQEGALSIDLEVSLQTSEMRARGTAPHRLSFGPATNLYWTPAQLLAHHTSNGCNLRPGDLLGTGTISATSPEGLGSLLEITQGGRKAITLSSGETRVFLQDGDVVEMRGWGRRDGAVRIGFGVCAAEVKEAVLS